MKVTMYAAISIDGFIARNDGQTDWVKDLDSFPKAMSESDCIIYGRKTYDQMIEIGEFPYQGIHNIVLTSEPEKYRNLENAEFKTSTPVELIKELELRGFQKILIPGGSLTNTQFLKANLVDELITDIHPIILGDGIKLINNAEPEVNLERVSQQEIENGLLQIRYKIIK